MKNYAIAWCIAAPIVVFEPTTTGIATSCLVFYALSYFLKRTDS